MDFRDIPTPDTFLASLLGWIFGPRSIVVGGFLFVWALWSWVSLAIRSKTIIAPIVRAVMNVPPLARAIGFVITLFMLALQLVWLFSSYVVGNGLSYFLTDRSGWTDYVPDWQVIDTLRWDWVSEVYVCAAVAALAAAYVTSFRSHSDDAHVGVFMLSAPLAFLGVVSLLFTVLTWT